MNRPLETADIVLRQDALTFAQWADDCIASEVIRPSGYYLGTLYALSGFAKRVARSIKPADPIDYLAAVALQEIAVAGQEARRSVDAILGIPEPF